MHRSWLWALHLALLGLMSVTAAFENQTVPQMSLLENVDIFDPRPPGCPPCFDCNLGDFKCHQFANCSKANGRCICPPGYGGNDCSRPLCGSLPRTRDRAPPKNDDKGCVCDKGWEGINCNVCKTNEACAAMMPKGEGEDGVCYRAGLVVKEMFQMCDITNRKIIDQLHPKKPHATFSCAAGPKTCNFQFWVDNKESFYCGLDTCKWKFTAESDKNTTRYDCEHIKCACIPGRMLCGEAGSIDIGDFLDQSIKGPASFTQVSTEGGSPSDGSKFSEPAMNNLISSVFGDKSITLSCSSGECLYKTEVPGYVKPIKKINTPLIAGVIAGCALFIVALVLLVWFLSRRSSQRHGPIHLSDEDDAETLKLMADHKPASLHFENVSYYLNGKHILSDVQGAVRPGELLAIMGASGAGKTTFLDILARKNKRGAARGDFYVNGEKVSDDDFRNVIGFVDQDDTMLPTLTVHETIMDSALLRLPKEMGRPVKEQKVEDVERQLGIYHIRNQMIGSEEGSGRGISGGEKRRVGIACELVTSPSILFLDEPTSGLDSFNAYNVVECLVNLVKTYNRTVVFTIHQPRSNIVALFDQLILLARGRAVYSGPFSGCQSYFDSLGYSCPPGFNIADYLVDLTMHAGVKRSPIDDYIEREQQGAQTRSSSAMAVKSIPSISNFSTQQSHVGSPSNSSLRPSNKRQSSIRQQQEQQLFTRKTTATTAATRSGYDTPATARSEDDPPLLESNSRESSQAWLKLSRQTGAPPPPPPHLLSTDDAADGSASFGQGSSTETDLDILIRHYANSDVAGYVRDDIKRAVEQASNANTPTNSNSNANGDSAYIPGRIKGYRKVGLLSQLRIVSLRTWRNLYRNPMLMLTHYAISIVLAVFLGWLYYGLTDDIAGFQNRLGLFFFVLALFGFSTLTSLTVFAPERLLFVRERAKGYYHPISYYAAKVLFDIVPLRLIPPIILGVIIYPMTGLVPSWAEFFKFLLFLVLFNLAAAAICLFIGIVFRSQGLANLIGSLVMLFSLLYSGLLLNRAKIPKPALWLQYLSIFHYSFEGIIVNEVKYLSLTDHKYGLDIEVPGSAILSSFGFNVQDLWADVIGLAIFAAAFLVIAYGALHILLVERR